ncbi:MAG: DUF899 domain-containing protein [Roseibium sp.]|uniref:DUF899 domain-containing protein n=1 Tax=Roseibium sp. TaxID=1936156 RepID=UPI001B2F10E5|nr:DUF899 domain-containing protein [Roseibium sp.]MBO6893800.1 DUF899 domain-containing protein [Roseibium sp.]MBO6930269.1 DUF899 domain-containing protein [Roseibium sp.]
MTKPAIVDREDWLRARLDLLEREKEHTHLKDEISAARRALPWVRLTKSYIFQTETGPQGLSDLFGPYSQLITYHFMFGPNWEEGCKSCSFWADSYEGLSSHFAARDIAFTAVSSAPLDRLLEFRRRMGWTFNWVSSHQNGFNHDFDVGFDETRPKDRSRAYNFGMMPDAFMDEMHGTSVFAKDENDDVFHTYSMYGRGLDATNAAYAYIDLTPKGRNEPPEGNPMEWVRHHDRY